MTEKKAEKKAEKKNVAQEVLNAIMMAGDPNNKIEAARAVCLASGATKELALQAKREANVARLSS